MYFPLNPNAPVIACKESCGMSASGSEIMNMARPGQTMPWLETILMVLRQQQIGNRRYFMQLRPDEWHQANCSCGAAHKMLWRN
jgi:hypothetical protein